jgi:hypothetical protein
LPAAQLFLRCVDAPWCAGEALAGDSYNSRDELMTLAIR